MNKMGLQVSLIWLKWSVVTCYFRHLGEIFKKAGIEVAKQNKRRLDEAIRDIVGVKYENCPATWREVKKRLAEDEERFVSDLKEKWSQET